MSIPGIEAVVRWIVRPIHRASAYFVVRKELARHLKVLPGPWRYVADRWWIDHARRDFTPQAFLGLLHHDASRPWLLRYLRAGLDPQIYSENGEGPLHRALRSRAEGVVELLLTETRLEVDARTDARDTPLILAARNGLDRAVKALLLHEADVKCRNDRGESALLEAARRGHAEVVRLLEKAGASEPGLEEEVARWRALRAIEAAGLKRNDETFLDLVDREDQPWVDTFLAAGVHAKARRPDKDTALHLAARHETPDMTERLLDFFAARSEPLESLLEARNGAGDTPLLVAAGAGREGTVSLLLDRGACIDAHTHAGDGALVAAARNDHWSVFELLRERGATEPDLAVKIARIRLERAGLRGTAEELFERIGRGDRKAVEWFLEAGVGRGARNADSETALAFAVRRGPEEVVELLLRLGNFDLEARGRSGDTVLIVAAREGREPVVKALLAHGASPHAENAEGASALLEAARRGHAAIVLILQAAGAAEPDLEARVAAWRARREIDAGEHEFTGEAFLRLVRTGQASWVERFVRAGIDPGLRDEGFSTALHLAAALPAPEVLRILLAAGRFDLEAVSSAGETPLIVAARQGRDEAVRLLLEHGASLDARNPDGAGPLFEAARGGHAAVVRLLEERGASEPDLERRLARWRLETAGLFTPEQLVLAARRGDRERVAELLLAGMDINALGDREETALHAAVRLRRTPVVELLLEQPGLDLDAPNGRGLRAAELAAAREIEDLVELLADHGARMDASAAARERLSQRWSQELRATDLVPLAASGQRELVTLFLDAGTSPDALDDLGRSALVEAARAGRTDVVETLLDRGATVDLVDRSGVRAVAAAEAAGHAPLAALLRARGAAPAGPERRRLADAVTEEDLAAARTALDAGVSPDERSDRGEPALVAAARQGHASLVETLLERSADPSARDPEGRTALLAAAEAGMTDVLEQLLGRPGIDVEAPAPDGATPLILAAHHGHFGAVRALLAAGANPEARDSRGRTALLAARTAGHAAVAELLAAAGEGEPLEAELLAAASRGDAATVQELLDRGADPEIPDAEGRTPLARAASRGWTSVVRALLDGRAAIDPVDEDGRTPAMLAAAAGREETLELLLDRGAGIERTDGEGATALLLAAAAGRGRTVVLLAGRGADPNRGAGGTTPLVEICRHGNLEAARALIEAGAEVDQQVGFGHSPWVTAALAGHQEILELLEAEGARRGRDEARLFLAARRGDEQELPAAALDEVTIDARDREGWTALMVATAEGHDGVARRLLEHGADPEAADRTGSSEPLMLAAALGRVSTLELLLSRVRADPEMEAQALLVAARNGHAEVVRLLAERRNAPVEGPRSGGVPLVAAAHRGHYQVVRTLLELGAKKDRSTPAGLNALMAAQLQGHDRVVELLLDHGARAGLHESRLLLAASAGKADEIERLLSSPNPPNLHARDHLGRTALMRACAGGHRAAAEALLEHEGSEAARRTAASQTDGAGRTTLMWAAGGGDAGIVRQLLALEADPTARSKRRRSALLEASRHGRPAVVAALLQALDDDEARRAEVNHQDSRGATPLLEALTYGSPERSWAYRRVVELLLGAGAVQGREAGELLSAIRRGDERAVGELLPRVDLDGLTVGGKPPLHLAVESGGKGVVKLLLGHVADVDAAGPRDVTALMLAARQGRSEIVALLLEARADPNRVDTDESNALLEAITHGHEAVARQLLEEGADVNHRNRAGDTPLLAAARGQSEPIVHALLDPSRAPRLDERDRRGRTALALAKLHGAATGTLQADLLAPGARIPTALARRLGPIEAALLEAGARSGWNDAELILAVRPGGSGPSPDLLAAADLHVRDLEGETPLLLACRSGDVETAGALLDRGAAAGVRDDRGRTPLMEAARADRLELVERLLASQPRLDLDAQDETGETALLEAAGAGADDLVRFLVDRGASVRIANEEGETPLIRAAGRCDVETLRAILGKEANACARTKGYRTALTEAAGAGREAGLELLLAELRSRLPGQIGKRSTVINAVDRSSRTALDWAVAEGHEGCAQLLRRHGGKSVTETDFMVYTTPDGHCYHRHRCGAIHLARERDTLVERFMRDAIQEHYEFCDRCTPSLATIDWKC